MKRIVWDIKYIILSITYKLWDKIYLRISYNNYWHWLVNSLKYVLKFVLNNGTELEQQQCFEIGQ